MVGLVDGGSPRRWSKLTTFSILSGVFLLIAAIIIGIAVSLAHDQRSIAAALERQTLPAASYPG